MGALAEVDLSGRLKRKEYEAALKARQLRLAQLRLALGGKLGAGPSPPVPSLPPSARRS